MRLIDADALGNRMYHESFEKDSDLQRWDGGCWIRYKLFEQVLRAAPTIDLTHPIPSNTLGALDCVSREDLTKGIETYFGDLPIAVHYDMLALAQRLPPVQPRKGKWIDIKHTFMTKCSVCDWINNDDSSYNFCPNCGCRMEEGGSDEKCMDV